MSIELFTAVQVHIVYSVDIYVVCYMGTKLRGCRIPC